MTIEIPIKDLLPNPFRNMKTYRINEEKVEELIASFKLTGFWPNIIGRRKNGKVEIAYGHHRKEAGERHYGKNHKVEVVVQDLDDATMIKMMASENGDFWKTDFIVEMENVETVVKQYAAGVIQLPAAESNYRSQDLRYAPSFLVTGKQPHARAAASFNTITVAKFLGLVDKKGDAKQKIVDAINAHEYVEAGVLTIERFKGLSNKQAESLLTETRIAQKRIEHDLKREQEALEKAEREAEEAKARAAKARADKATSEREKQRTEKAVQVAETKKVRAQEKTEEVRSFPSRVAERVSSAMKSGEVGYRQARQLTNKMSERLGKQPPPSEAFIEKICDRLHKFIGKPIVAGAVLTDEIQAIIDNKDAIDAKLVQRVQKSLIYLAERATNLADKLDGKHIEKLAQSGRPALTN